MIFGMTRLLATATLLASLAASTAVLAQDQDEKAPPSVSARQGLMHIFSFSLSTLGGMAKGEIAYDAGTAQAAADRIVGLSDIPQQGLWPDGTSIEEVDTSRALPAIWTETDDFRSGFDTLHEAAMKMQSAAGESAEAIGGQMKAIGDACGGCHEDYRKSDD